MTRGMARGCLIGAAMWLLLALAVWGAEQRFSVDPPVNADGSVLTDLVGIWLCWAPERLVWSDDGRGNVTWGDVVTVGPTNRLWLPVGTYTGTISAVAGPYTVWALAVASYGETSQPARVSWRIGTVKSVTTRKVVTP